MAEPTKMKIVYEVTQNGADVPKVVTTVSNDPAAVGQVLTRLPGGVGRPFWAWLTLRSGTLAAADFTGAPTITSDAATNAAAVQALLDSQPDAGALLTWA